MRPWVAAFALVFATATASPQDSRPAEAESVLRVPLRDGRLSLLALARAVGDAAGLDGRTISFPDREVAVDGIVASITISALEILAHDALAFDRTADVLLIRVDRARARELQHDLRHGIASWLAGLTGLDLLSHEYRLELPEPPDPRAPVVLLIHGMGGDGETWAALRRAIGARAPGLPAGEFLYSSDEGIDVIARELAERLRAYAARNPERPVYVVAHSMGGLVARSVIETPGLDPGDVRLLVMLGTPQTGSRLSRMRVALDLASYAVSPKRPGKLDEVLRNVLGDADADLRPGSVVLNELNARPRNPSVEYRVLLGTRAPLREQELASLRESWSRASARLPYAEVFAPTLRSLLDDLEEVENGKGDGAVALRRGELPGVESVRVDLDHPGLARSPRAHAQVIEWLEARRRLDATRQSPGWGPSRK